MNIPGYTPSSFMKRRAYHQRARHYNLPFNFLFYSIMLFITSSLSQLVWERLFVGISMLLSNDVQSPYYISIVIPIFNKRTYLYRCMNSSLRQTYQNHQVVFVDDGSTDGSFEIVARTTRYDPRVKIVKHKYNIGLIHARITGVKQSNAMYIFTYDPDDIIYPDAISKLVRSIKYYNFSVDVFEFVQNTVFRRGMVRNFRQCTANFTDPKKLVFQYFSGNMSHNVHKRLIKRDLYLRALKIVYPFVRGKRYIYCEDRIQIVIIFALINRYICVDYSVYKYFAENKDGSETTKYHPKKQQMLQYEYSCQLMDYIKNNTWVIQEMRNGKNVFKGFLKGREELFNSMENITKRRNRIKLKDTVKYFSMLIKEEQIIFKNRKTRKLKADYNYTFV